MNKRYKSEALAAAHETAFGLTEAGVMAKRTMRTFDEMCLTPVEEMTPEQIRQLRLREHASQAVFARYLNVTTGLVSQWETRTEAAAGRFVEAVGVGGEERSERGRVTVPTGTAPSGAERRALKFEKRCSPMHDRHSDSPRSRGTAKRASHPGPRPQRESRSESRGSLGNRKCSEYGTNCVNLIADNLCGHLAGWLYTSATGAWCSASRTARRGRRLIDYH